MELKEFAQLVKSMRENQKEYFKTRRPSAMYASKELERKIDKEIIAILKPQEQTENELF